ncbi:hypothetical protein ACWEO2_42805 [Nocardia sp. NPDC004278]
MVAKRSTMLVHGGELAGWPLNSHRSSEVMRSFSVSWATSISAFFTAEDCSAAVNALGRRRWRHHLPITGIADDQ